MPMSMKLWTTRSSSDDAGVEVGELLQRIDDGTGDERQVGEAEPSAAFHSALTLLRVTSTLAKSTSTTLNACGLTPLLITMWLPVSLRILREPDRGVALAAA